MKVGNMSRSGTAVSVLAFVAVFMMLFACVAVDQDSDAIVIDKMKLEAGDTYTEDVTITGSFIVEGNYSGTITLRNGNVDAVRLSFSSVSGFAVYVNDGDQYIVGNMTSGSDTGSFKLISGTIRLGSDDRGFTGMVIGGSAKTMFNSIVGADVSLDGTELSVSGDVSAASDVGFDTVASVEMKVSSAYTGNEEISISGMLSNSILGNSMEVLSKDSGVYQLRGILNYIDRDGGSAGGILFDMIVGDLNGCTHAVIMSTSSPVDTSDHVISLGNGNYLVCVQSGMDNNITMGGKTISFAGLVMGEESVAIIPSVTGLVGSMTVLSDTVVGDLTVGSSVGMTVADSATMVVRHSSHIVIEGSLSVNGTVNVIGAGSLTTEYTVGENGTANGLVVSSGSFTVGSSDDINVHGVYYTSSNDRIYTSLSKAVNKQTDGKVHVGNSYILTDNISIGSGVTIVNDGLFYIDSGARFVNNGTFINNSTAGLIVTYDGRFDSSSIPIQNSGYVMAYGLFENSGSFNSKAYADISNYNNKTTKLACLPVMLDNVTSGDLTLYRDVDVTKDAELPSGVTLYIMGENDLKIGSSANLTIRGTVSVSSTIVVEGTMSVSGRLIVLSGGAVTVNGTMVLSGSIQNSGTVSVEGELQVGIAPSKLPYANPASVTGEIALGQAGLVIVYGNANDFNASRVLSYSETTRFIFEGETYATEYATASDVRIVLLTPKITGIGFAQWLDEDGKKIQGVHYVGDQVFVTADINTATYSVTLGGNEGISWILDDITDYGHGGVIDIAYGSHYLKIKVADGYKGTPTILRVTSSGSQVVEQGKEFMIVEDCDFKVVGVYLEGNDDDNGLVAILCGIIITSIALIIIMSFLLFRKRQKIDGE
jgi:hypothetical protein